MTISLNDRFVSLSPSAGTTSLDFDFRLQGDTGLAVTRIRAGVTTTLTKGVDWSLASSGPSGGSILLAAPSLAEDVYRLIGMAGIERLSDFLAAQGFASGKFNTDLDYLTLIAQELRRDADRAWKSDFGQTGRKIATIGEGHFWKADAEGNMVDGGPADDIETAEENAEAALAAKEAAEAAQALAEAARDIALAAVPPPRCATRSVLAALNTAAFTSAILAEAGREGEFKQVTAVSVAGWLAIDTDGAVVIASTEDAAKAWLRIGVTYLDPLWFGFVADGVDSHEGVLRFRGNHAGATAYVAGDHVKESGLGYMCVENHTSGTFATDLGAGKWAAGVFTGTDNTPALARLIAFQNLTGLTIRAQEGDYRFVNPSTATNSPYGTLTGQRFSIEGHGRVRFFIDEDLTANKNYNFWKTDTVATNTNYRERKEFRAVNIRYRGRWSHKPGGNVTPGNEPRAHVHYISGYAQLTIANCQFEDIAGSVNRIFTCDNVLAVENRCYRIAKGSLRFQDCNNGYVAGNYFEHCDDDIIDVHASANGIRKNWSIVDNIGFGCESIVGLGAANFTVRGNKQYFPHGNPYFFAPSQTSEGDNASCAVSFMDNQVFNGVNRSTDGSTIGALALGGGATLGGLAADTIAGAYDGSSKIIDQIQLDLMKNVTTSVPPSMAIAAANNIFIRTKPSGVAYSTWGVGLMFGSEGFFDPTISEASFLENGIVINSDVHGFKVNDNQAIGFRSGAGVLLRFLSSGDARHWGFRNGQINDNVIQDCHDGIETSITYGGAATINLDIDIDDNVFDLDPKCLQTARTDLNSGRWNSAAGTADKSYAITLGNTLGYRFRNNTIRNCYEPVYNDATKVKGVYAGNTVICQPVSDGHAYQANNRGVAVPYRAGLGFGHRFEDCQPSSATYGQELADQMPPAYVTTPPSAGWAMAGLVIPRVDPAVDGNNMMVAGIIRLLTGNAWVAGTDYALMRTSTVSPAT